MKRFERELSIFFFTSVPCFVLASAFFFLVKEDVIFGIIALAFSLFLVCVCFWLNQESMTNAGSICGEESQDEGPDKESLDRCIKELQEQVHLLEDKIDKYEPIMMQLKEKQDQAKIIDDKEEIKPKAPPDPKPEPQKAPSFITCNIKGIEDKKELTAADSFSIVRNGRGVMKLYNNCLLVPNDFETGKEVTSDMHSLWTSYSMGKLFELNSRDMIHFKIIKIIPAKIRIIKDENGSTLQGVLQRKGKIELG